jgi:hypothetical protein
VFSNGVFLPDGWRGSLLIASGRPEEAMPVLEGVLTRINIALESEPEHFGYLSARCHVLGSLASLSPRADLKPACLLAAEHIYDDAMDRNFRRAELAGAMAHGGATDAALDLFELAMSEAAGPTAISLRSDPRLQPLHGNPRWQALVGEGQ